MTDRRLRLAVAALALLGIAIAGYLTYVHYRGIEVACLAGGGGCETVQSSRYAKLAGVPVATLGLVGYVLIFASAWVRSFPGKAAGAALAFAGFGFSVYLTYREVFTIEAICQWCVASAVVMTLIAALSAWRLLRVEDELGPDDAGAPAATPPERRLAASA